MSSLGSSDERTFRGSKNTLLFCNENITYITFIFVKTGVILVSSINNVFLNSFTKAIGVFSNSEIIPYLLILLFVPFFFQRKRKRLGEWGCQ